MEILEIFPNPIFIETYPEKESLNELLIEEITSGIGEKNDATPKLTHYSNKLNFSILYDKKFKEFKEWCEERCTEYVKDVIGYNIDGKMFITDSWLNKCDLGGFQYPHLHSNSYISGTYYINFEDGHSPLSFIKDITSPFSNKQTLSLQKSNISTKYNSNFLLKPNSGELVLWESNLCHGHFDNRKDGRLSLSMNFMPSVMSSGKYGFKIIPCTDG